MLRERPSGDLLGWTQNVGMAIGHVSPEALAGGPLGTLRDGVVVRIIVDRMHLTGSVDLIGENGVALHEDEGARILALRAPRPDLAPDPLLPADTRLCAALQDVSGGPWGGSVFDVDTILTVIAAGRKALES